MSLELSNIKGIVFDLGYTLIEYRDRPWTEINRQGKKSAYEKLLRLSNNLPDFETFEDRYETVKEEYRSAAFDNMKGWIINNAVAEILNEYEIENSAAQADYFIEELYKYGRDMMVVFPDTVATLKYLKELGYRTGVISNTIYPAYLHEADLRSFGLEPYLDFRIYSSEFGLRKPRREIFKAAVDRIGLGPPEIAYVGDRFDTDALGAREAGLKPIIKYCKKENYPDPMPSDISVIHAVSDLPELFTGNSRSQKIGRGTN